MQTAVRNGQPSPAATLAEKLIICVSQHQASFDKRNLNCTNRPTDWQKHVQNWLRKTSSSSLRRRKRLSLFKNHFRYVKWSLNESWRRLHALPSTRDTTLVSCLHLRGSLQQNLTGGPEFANIWRMFLFMNKSGGRVSWSALSHIIILLCCTLPIRSGCGRCDAAGWAIFTPLHWTSRDPIS